MPHNYYRRPSPTVLQVPAPDRRRIIDAFEVAECSSNHDMGGY